MKRMFNRIYCSLVVGLCVVAGCWIGSAYVVYSSDIGSKPPVAPESLFPRCPTSTCAVEVSAGSSANVHWVDRELLQVLLEIDVRNPSPGHEAFLSRYMQQGASCINR